jgi:hypothetical protein
MDNQEDTERGGGGGDSYLTNTAVLFVCQICGNFLALLEGIVLDGVGRQAQRFVNLPQETKEEL